jgi:hypothetical protein
MLVSVWAPQMIRNSKTTVLSQAPLDYIQQSSGFKSKSSAFASTPPTSMITLCTYVPSDEVAE